MSKKTASEQMKSWMDGIDKMKLGESLSTESIIKHSEDKDHIIRELISLNLWQARRLHPQYKKFAYDDLEKITDEEYERL